MLICFELNRTELIEYRNATDGRTDRIAVSISRVSMLTHYKTHSLTAALDQLRVVASSTSNDPGPRSRQHQQIGQCLLPLAAANFSVDDPGGRFQSAAGGVPVWASIDSCSACEAGVFSGRRQM